MVIVDKVAILICGKVGVLCNITFGVKVRTAVFYFYIFLNTSYNRRHICKQKIVIQNSSVNKTDQTSYREYILLYMICSEMEMLLWHFGLQSKIVAHCHSVAITERSKYV